MGGVVRIRPDLLAVGKSLFPLPYVLLLRDLAGLDAGRTLPRIPRTAVEAAVRMAGERRRRGFQQPPAAGLHAPAGVLADGQLRPQEQRQGHQRDDIQIGVGSPAARPHVRLEGRLPASLVNAQRPQFGAGGSVAVAGDAAGQER